MLEAEPLRSAAPVLAQAAAEGRSEAFYLLLGAGLLAGGAVLAAGLLALLRRVLGASAPAEASETEYPPDGHGPEEANPEELEPMVGEVEPIVEEPEPEGPMVIEPEGPMVIEPGELPADAPEPEPLAPEPEEPLAPEPEPGAVESRMALAHEVPQTGDIREAQRLLAPFGAGAADGVPGPRYRQALRNARHRLGFANLDGGWDQPLENYLRGNETLPKDMRARRAERGFGQHVAWSRYVYGDVDVEDGLRDALAAVGRDLGVRVQILSGRRTYAEQVYLYRKYGPGRAARPGSSRHETGRAADCYINGVAIGRYPGAWRALNRHGLSLPVRGESWHVERGR